MHLYHFHLSDGTVKSVTTEKHHSHHFGDDVVDWFNAHKEDLAKFGITVLTLIAIAQTDKIIIWKK